MRKVKIERDKVWPYFWEVRDSETKELLDKDQYLNDIRERLKRRGYEIVEVVGKRK